MEAERGGKIRRGGNVTATKNPFSIHTYKVQHIFIPRHFAQDYLNEPQDTYLLVRINSLCG